METNEKTVLSENENISPKKKNNKGIIIGIIIAAVIVLAVGIGLGIYNSPENRMSRQLDLGQKYLEEQNYEQAVVAFNDAIEIDDRCLEAYLGGMEAYAMLGDIENQKALYEKALGKVREFNAEEIEADRENVVMLYLEAETVYAGDDEKILDILQEGYKLTGDERLESKIENLQTKIKEAEKLLVQKKVEEYLQDERDQFVDMWCNISNGSCYLTYEQIEKKVSPYIELLELYKELFPNDTLGLDSLQYLYYMVGEYEACLDIRKHLYDITGSEVYSIEGYMKKDEYGEVVFDKFGRSIKQIDPDGGICEYEYDNNGRIIKYCNSTGYVYGNVAVGQNYGKLLRRFEYDTDGRILKETKECYDDSEKIASFTVLTYEYNEHGCKLHLYEENFNGALDIVEADLDIIIDQYGNATNWNGGYSIDYDSGIVEFD